MAAAARALMLHIPPHIHKPRHWQSRAQHHCISTSSVLCDSVPAVPYCSWLANMCGSCLFSVMACFPTVG